MVRRPSRLERFAGSTVYNGDSLQHLALEGRIISEFGQDVSPPRQRAGWVCKSVRGLTVPSGVRFYFRRLARAVLVTALVSLLCAVIVPPASGQQNLIAGVEIHGNRRIPAETIRARIFTKAGDVYDQAAIERDFNSLWNTGYFEDLRFEREETAKGWILHVYVQEKPVIREITYQGLSSVTQSKVLERYRERKLSLTQESQYDPTRVKRAEVLLKELLAENGRQFAEIRTEVRRIPPAAVGVTFIIHEGPKVKVGKIQFEGQKKLSSRKLRRAMRNLRPIGIPHSIFLESLFHKTYDSTKLNEDMELVRRAYQTEGYFRAVVGDPKTSMRDTNTGFHVPLFQKRGKAIDITVPVEEGDRYRLKQIEFTGDKSPYINTAALPRVFKMQTGDIFNVELVAKGLEDLRKVYGEYGYINFTPVPDTIVDEEKKEITLKIDLDNGKQYSVRRIEFQGNTTTRDKVIRRELAIEEGQLYNTRLWELSVLRLNQLGYFEPLKPEQDSEVRQNNQEGTVDITLKVKEKGKNSIGLSGGVSGLAGSFIGLSYETNNFLGLGETLSVIANVGSQQRNVQFGFTEPYLFDRSLQFGFTVFSRRFDFDQLRQTEIFTGQRLDVSQDILQSLQNFTQSSTGFTTSLSYPLKRSFKRVGLTYALDTSTTKVYSQFSQAFFQELNFRNISGPDALKGVVTSKLLPSFTHNTVDHPMTPHSGKSFYLGGEIAGIGGNVSFFRPIIEWKHFIPMRGLKPARPGEARNTLGYRIQATFLSGYGGRVAPPWERSFVGGENDLRGFDIRGVSPIAFFVERVDFPLRNPDGTLVPRNPGASVACTETNLANCITVPLPVHRLIFPGGDTSVIANVEYRIPLVGPVTLAPFLDFGFNGIARASQLQINQAQLELLNSTQFGCPRLDNSFSCVGGISQPFGRELQIVSSSNWKPRMSTGLELQVIMPIVNAPFRVYYAFNPLRLNSFSGTPFSVTRDMFPAGGAGDYSFRQALSLYGSDYRFKEPNKTFRITVSTTF
jgi:outer membrane protein insertion porin family